MADSTATATPEQEQEAAPAEEAVAIHDATGAYESWTFPNTDAEEEAPVETDTTEQEGTAEAKPEEKTEEQTEGEEPELSEAELETVRRALAPRGKRGGLPDDVAKRVDQLVQNRYGNELQQARAEARRQAEEQIRQQDQEWQQDTELYQRLESDEEFWNQAVAKHGRPQVMRWMANYEDRAQQRQSGGGQETEQFKAEYQQAFNQQAIGEFRETVANLLPRYSELPESARNVVENAQFDPNKNWLADAVEAVGKGYEELFKRMERDHEKALEEARAAARNETLADTDNSGPVQVRGDNAAGYSAFKQVERDYAFGRIGHDEWERQKKIFGED